MNQILRKFGSSAASAATRIPSIKFLGKRSNKFSESIKKPVGVVPAVSSAPKLDTKVVKQVKVGSGVEFTTLSDKAWFGRPKLSLNEILAIESGGATEFNPPVSAPAKKR
jgi:hypothetical protein